MVNIPAEGAPGHGCSNACLLEAGPAEEPDFGIEPVYRCNGAASVWYNQ